MQSGQVRPNWQYGNAENSGIISRTGNVGSTLNAGNVGTAGDACSIGIAYTTSGPLGTLPLPTRRGITTGTLLALAFASASP